MNSKEKIGFIYGWAFPFWAFVWEDLLVFSFYSYLVIVLVILLQDIRIGMLLFVVFGVVRAAGETLYFFLQQFLHPSIFPHNINRLTHHFQAIRNILGEISDQKCYIIMQVTHQVLLVTFLSALLFLVLNWGRLPAWL